MNPPACIAPLPIFSAIIFRLSSHALSAFSNCTTLSLLPWRISLMLTLPIFTSLSRRKSNRRNKPSSLSSPGSVGKAESATGGEEGRPLIASASRRIARPPQIEPEVSFICSDEGRWELAHSINPSSTGTFCSIQIMII